MSAPLSKELREKYNVSFFYTLPTHAPGRATKLRKGPVFLLTFTH